MTELETLVGRVQYAVANYEDKHAAAERLNMEQRRAWQDAELACIELETAQADLLRMVKNGAASLHLHGAGK